MEVPVTNKPLASAESRTARRTQASDLALDLDGRLVAAAEIGVEAAGQHLGQHADHRAAALDPAHEAGMHVAAGIGQDVVHEFAVHRLQRLRRRAAMRAAKMLAYRVRHRLSRPGCSRMSAT